MPATAYAFDLDTASTPDSSGGYAATLSGRWTTGNGTPNGGYVLATAVRAGLSTVGSDELLTVAATFLRPSVPGAATVHTEVVRQGRRISTVEATLRQQDRDVVRVTAQVAPFASRAGADWQGRPAPALPAPQQCRVAEHEGHPGTTVTQQVEHRMAGVPGWVSGDLRGDPTLEFWVGFADGRPADLLALPFFADSFIPAMVLRGVTGGVSVHLTTYLQRRPRGRWIACRATSRHLVGGYVEEDVEMYDEYGEFVGQSRQLLLTD